jgi:ATP-binding cassette subfamily B protein/subfamily B ATP-binding cassette protein MsbA
MPSRPASSRRRYRDYRAELKAHRTEGARLTAVAHVKQKGGQRSFFALFVAFWATLRGSRTVAIACLGTVTIATGLKLIPPAATGFVLDYVLGDRPLPDRWAAWIASAGASSAPATLLAFVAAGIIAIALVSIAVGITGRYINTTTTMRFKSGIRRRVFAHAVRLPLHRLHALKSGGVASVLREDAGGVGDLLFSMLYNPWRAVVQLGGTIVILAMIDWRLLVGALAIIPLAYYTHRAWIARIRPIWRDIRATRQHADGHATEVFSGIRVVRSFGRQRTETGRFTRNNHLLTRQEMLAWVASRGVEIAWAILIPLASALLLWYGGSRILSDRALVAAGALDVASALTTGDLVMFLFYVAMLLEPLAMLAESATAFQSNLAALDRVLDLLAEPVEFAGATGMAVLHRAGVRGRITLREVSFRYPKTATNVLTAIDLDVPAGNVIALVGRSGAGKTTLCNLIARFYDPTEGVVELDGRDLRTIDVEAYRRLLGIVEQDIFLFDGTIADNVAYGRRGATRADVVRAAALAHADEFIDRIEAGYDAVIGERGVKLSGGQRQRLAIARALLADPRILILDEATSNLDTESERLIQLSLRMLMRGRTSFVIAHRLSTITHADRIIVLEGGRVAEQGTHAELMAAGGRYRDMVHLQLLEGPASGSAAGPADAVAGMRAPVR